MSRIELNALVEQRQQWRAAAVRVVWTNGCFDVMHPGHIQFLTAARALGDILVVGVNGDASVRRLKGPSRPFVPLPGRVAMLAGLRAVDHVVVLSGDTPCHEIELLRPEVCCKDSDYEQLPLPERDIVEAYGGQMFLLPRITGWSTTGLTDQMAAQVAEVAFR